MAKLIKANGTTTDIEPKNGTNFTLQELYEALKCRMIEVVTAKNGKILICDENGGLRGDIVNVQGLGYALELQDPDGIKYYVPWLNKIASRHSEYGIQIVGNVILCNNSELK